MEPTVEIMVMLDRAIIVGKKTGIIKKNETAAVVFFLFVRNDKTLGTSLESVLIYGIQFFFLYFILGRTCFFSLLSFFCKNTDICLYAMVFFPVVYTNIY